MGDSDPFDLFSGGRSDACLGEWKNDRLQVLIKLEDGKLVLESGKKLLTLTEVKPERGAKESLAAPHEWIVADPASPDTIVYICRVLGYGRDTRLTLEPPKQKDGKVIKAVLQRVEHLALVADPPKNLATKSGSWPDKAQANGGRGRGTERGKRSRGGRDASRSRSGSRSCSGSFSGSGSYSSRSRSASRSRSRRRSRRRGRKDKSRSRKRSPRRRGGGRGKGGGGGGADAADGPITTLFISGLPGDAREDEVRRDCEVAGNVSRIVLMKRGSDLNAFVRYEKLADAERALDRMLENKMEVCQTRIKAEMARRNTN